MRIARRHEGKTKAPGDVDGAFGATFLDVQAVVLDLDVEVLAEELSKPLRQPSGLLQLVFQDELAELTRGAAAQADDVFLVLSEQLLVDPGHVVVALEEGGLGYLDEVRETSPAA